jgi:uncharacterized membrane protein
MQRDFITRLKSRKFLSAIGYAVFIFASEVMGWPVSYEAYAAIGGAIGLFILGESYIDSKAVE